MSKENVPRNYKLTVPVDASGIEGRKAEQQVKVAVQDREGKVQSQKIRLDAKGNGTATFGFAYEPGAVRVVVGPEDASDEEILGLQTISMTIQPNQWQSAKALAIPPIRISPYYWWWWLRWCRFFTINGHVLCADGSPVPGATVCAYDADWWWWWISKQQVGNCATTDATGAFTITFRWCCGWWPWWWWRYRYWQFDPYLAERIAPVLDRDPTLGRLAISSPTPNLNLFENLLTEGRATPVRQLSRQQTSLTASQSGGSALELSLRVANRKAMPAATAARSLQAAIDPSELAGLRERLVKRLPVAPELERLHIWPWWPWQPWWDCTPDIIFRVTQDCFGQNKVIVNEGIGDIRWDVPTNLNVTLIANDEACCIQTCDDPQDCPEGNCIVISQACGDQVNNIGGNPGAAPTPVGYQNPGVVSATGDRPYAGVVPISGVFGNTANVDYYEFEWATGSAGPWNPMPPAAAGGFSRQFWGYALPAGGPPPNFYGVPFNLTNISGQNVIETREHFEATNGAGTWGLTRFWTYNRDLLMVWLTDGTFADGTYYLRLKGYDLVGGNLTNPRILPLCDTEDDNYLVLTIDNRIVGAGSGHPASVADHPCGPGTIHLCTMEPDTDILKVMINGQDVSACTNVNWEQGVPLVVDFLAYDPDEHLSQYSLIATYGENLYTNLIALADSIVPLAGAPVPAAAQVGPTYGDALSQGATSPFWAGGAIRLTINDSSLAFPEPCCYQLELRAYKRTIVNCDHGLAHNNLSEYSFGVQDCSPVLKPSPTLSAGLGSRVVRASTKEE